MPPICLLCATEQMSPLIHSDPTPGTRVLLERLSELSLLGLLSMTKGAGPPRARWMGLLSHFLRVRFLLSQRALGKVSYLKQILSFRSIQHGSESNTAESLKTRWGRGFLSRDATLRSRVTAAVSGHRAPLGPSARTRYDADTSAEFCVCCF